MAKCFLLRLLGVVEDQLEEEKEDSIITKWDAELIELSALRYEALYKLIRRGYKYLKKSVISELVNKKTWDIFIKVCEEEINTPFEIRTNEFQEILIDQIKSIWKDFVIVEINRENIEILQGNQCVFNSQLLLLVTKILVQKSKKDNVLRTHLEDYFHKCRCLGHSIIDALEARNAQGKIVDSEQWRHGERHILRKNRPVRLCYKT